MEKGHKKFIIIGGIILVFIITLIISQSYIKNIKLNNEIENIIEEKNLTKEKNVIDKNIIDEKVSKSTTELPILTEEDEQTIEVQETEAEGFEEQGIIAYNGAEKTPNIQLGEYAGLTYYSQLDNRWRHKIYSSVGNTSQTIGTSGCGPASAAMIVSSIKGNITPDQMADLYTRYGYRSPNQGTYWSAFKWTADVFNIEYSECYRLDDAINKLKNKSQWFIPLAFFFLRLAKKS